MRIAFVSACRKESTGGHVRVAQEMARAFAAEHDVLLIYPDDTTRLLPESERLTIYEVRSAGEGDAAFPALWPHDVRGLTATLSAFRPDIVHAHDFPTLAILTQIWARRHGVPFVHTAHLLPEHYLKFGATDVSPLLDTRPAAAVTNAALRRFIAGCDAIVTPNHAGEESFRRFGHTGRLFIIPNGRDIARYAAAGCADVTSPRKQLIFIGWINHRKNQLYLLEALAHLPRSYELHLVGGVLDPAFRLEMDRYIAAHDLRNVTFAGPVAHEQIPGYLARSHVFVSASRMEVQSLSVIEALASGTPVVGLPNETVDELVDGGVGCRLPADAAPEAFAQAVEAICTLPQPEYATLCERARARVASLDWRYTVSETVRAYQELLGTRPAGRREPVRRGDWLLGAGMAAGSSAAYTLMRCARRLTGRATERQDESLP